MNDDFLNKIDIVDIISDYTPLKRQGNEYIGLCPFHNEKTPSFHVSRDKQAYYCFGCKRGGNVITFIRSKEGLDYYDALKYLSDKTGVELPENDKYKNSEKIKWQNKTIEINTVAAKYFHSTLKIGEEALEYLKKRKISPNTVKKFGLGYAPDMWDGLIKHLTSKGYTEKDILTAGLAIKTQKGGFIDRFRKRLMFPIFDVRGNVIAFGGRVLDDGLPKYMNSPETVCYKKKDNLYALNYARKSEQDNIVIVEGYMDAVMLYQAGIDNVVASLGTALTERQAMLLKRYTKDVVICYDSDMAGQIATLKGMDILADKGCNIRVITIPSGKDPDEYIKSNGPAAFRQLIDRADSLVEYKVGIYKKQCDMDTMSGKVSFLNMIAEALSKIDNKVEVEMYSRKIAEDYGISTEAILSEVYKNEKTVKTTDTRVAYDNIVDKASNGDESVENERRILILLSLDNDYIPIFDKTEGDSFFEDNDNLLIYKEMKKNYKDSLQTKPAVLMQMVDEVKAAAFAGILQNTHFETKDLIGKAINEMILKNKLRLNKKRREEILTAIKNTDSAEEKEKLKKEFVKVNHELKNLKR